MKAIETYYIPATNTRPRRMGATDGDRTIHRSLEALPASDRMVPSQDDALHAAMAQVFCEQLAWSGHLAGGHTKRGMVWVWVPEPVATGQEFCGVTVNMKGVKND